MVRYLRAVVEGESAWVADTTRQKAVAVSVGVHTPSGTASGRAPTYRRRSRLDDIGWNATPTCASQ